MTGSISFDRAAEYYDATRGYPAEVAAQIGAGLAALLPAGAHLLEIGIGTGRIACPLIARGVAVTGLDLSERMLARLLVNLGPDLPRPGLVLADATGMPWAPASFDAVLGVHVFHLISPWQQAVAETRRVLRPGGVLLVGRDERSPDSPLVWLRREWTQCLSAHGQPVSQPGIDLEDLVLELAREGVNIDELVLAEWETLHTPAAYIEHLESNRYSGSWNVDPACLPLCAAELRAWARAQFGDLDQVISLQNRFKLQRLRWQG